MGPQAVQDGHNSFPSYGYATAFDDDTSKLLSKNSSMFEYQYFYVTS